MKNPITVKHSLSLLLVSILTACGGGSGGNNDTVVPPPPPPPPVANVAPVADAGADQTANELTTLSLSGVGSDSDGSISRYSWTQLGGSNVILDNADTATATFTTPAIDADESLTFQLEVTDDDGASHSDTVVVTVLDVPNQLPTVNAGADQAADERSTVTLTGVANDDDGSIATYSWTQLTGNSVTLTDAQSASASFIAPSVDSDEVLTFELQVTDNEGATANDTVAITVVALPNQSPVADAGVDQNVDEERFVDLVSHSSDIDGHIVSYLWTQVSGTTVSIFSEEGQVAGFTAPEVNADEMLSFQLQVTDNNGATSTDTVAFTVAPLPNQSPIVDAGVNRTAGVGDTLSFRANARDRDGFINDYHWSQLSGTPVTLTNAQSGLASLIVPSLDADEELVFQLEVTDNEGASSTDSLKVTVLGISSERLLLADALNNIPDIGLVECIRSTTGAIYADQIRSISCHGGLDDFKVLSAQGVEQFVYLEDLAIVFNRLERIDVSRNTKLSEISLYDNQISSIDLSNNLGLELISLSNNQLSEIDLSQHNALRLLRLKNNQLTTVNIGSSTTLIELDLSFNQLSSVDLSTNPGLSSITVSNNLLESIDLSGNAQLDRLKASDNLLTEVSLSNNIKLSYLGLENNRLSDIDIKNNTLLSTVKLGNNQLTAIDLSNSYRLGTLIIHQNQLDTIKFGRSPRLNGLNISDNVFTSIDTSAVPQLFSLTASGNQLTALDLSANPRMEFLTVDNNQLSVMDLSHNPRLFSVDLNNNQLTSVPVGLSSLRTDGIFNLTVNPFDDEAIATLQTLQETYSRLTF